MVKKFNILIVLSMLLFLSISCVSASEDMNTTLSVDEPVILDSSSSDDVLSKSTIHEIDSSNYSRYFSSNGKLIATDVNSGDVLSFTGNWNNAKFNIDKKLSIVYSQDTPMKNCVFTLTEEASGSSIIGLKITNTVDNCYGIFLNGASNCIIKDCYINNTGQASYALCIANDANYNVVNDNVFGCYGITYGMGTRSSPAVLISGAHYNNITNNRVEVDDANGIYLSSYEGGPLKGGDSNYNFIYNNTIKCNVLPTSWAYGIQIMGSYNEINSNRIIGTFKGISTSKGHNKIINNRIINLTGADYNNPGVVVGGEQAIVGASNSIIINNTIENALILSSFSAIYAGSNSVVENNVVNVISSAYGIQAAGDNVLIKSNDVTTTFGAGIYCKGKFFNISIVDNTVLSKNGTGIFIDKESDKRRPGNITITGNSIVAKDYLINAKQADSNTVNVIENNAGRGTILTPEGSYDPSKPKYIFNGTTHIVTPENYRDYFDVGGTLTPLVSSGDILYFEGEFVNLGVLYINSAIKLTGQNPKFYNTTFRLSDGVWVENLTIKNKNCARINAWGILVYNTRGATIANCDIDVTDPNAAYAIYVVESSDVDVISNKLTSSGDYLTYTLLAISVEDCTFIDNDIHTIGTGIAHGFDSSHCVDGSSSCVDGSTCVGGDSVCTDGSTCVDGSSCVGGDSVCSDGNTLTGNHVLYEVYRTYGILMAYSSGCVVSGNKVNATSKLNKTSYTSNSSGVHNNISTNSIVGIDLYYDSHNNIFSDNYIYIKANDSYIYGMGVLGYYTGHEAPEGKDATNNQFINNVIVLEGTYFVQGLVIGSESKDTVLIGNNVSAKSQNYSYGINLETSQKSIIQDNIFVLNADVVYGIELFNSNNNDISGNAFDITAKQAYGMAFSNSAYNSVINNTIMNNVTGEPVNFKVYDSIGSGVGAIYLKSKSTNNIIKDNNFTSIKGYAILVDDLAVDNEIANNYLKSEKGQANCAINNTNGNIVEDNYVYLFNGVMPDMIIKYLENGLITLDIGVDGVLVKFYVQGEEIGQAVSSNGVATLNYKFDETFTPDAYYQIDAIASKENYLTKEFTSTLFIQKGSLDITLNGVSAFPTSKGNFVATVKDSFGNPISGLTVKFYRVQGRNVFIGEAKTDKNGVATLSSVIPTISVGNYEIIAMVDDDYFQPANKSSTLKVTYKPVITIYKANPVYYGNVIKYKVRVKDDTGKYAVSKAVSIKVNGKTYSVKTDKYGYAYLSLKLKAGTYTVTVSYKGVSSSSKITFKPTLIAKDRAAKKSKTAKFTVKLVYKNGKILKYKKITFKINGKTYSAKTNKYGVATLSIKLLKVGKFTITSTYGGCTISNKITVVK